MEGNLLPKPTPSEVKTSLTTLERAQEVDYVLPVPSLQAIEMLDDFICLAILASMAFDSLQQVACPSVMEEKDPLPETPEGSRSELIGAGATLRDAVRKTSTHVVDQEVGEEIHSLVGQRGTRDL